MSLSKFWPAIAIQQYFGFEFNFSKYSVFPIDKENVPQKEYLPNKLKPYIQLADTN